MKPFDMLTPQYVGKLLDEYGAFQLQFAINYVDEDSLEQTDCDSEEEMDRELDRRAGDYNSPWPVYIIAGKRCTGNYSWWHPLVETSDRDIAVFVVNSLQMLKQMLQYAQEYPRALPKSKRGRRTHRVARTAR